MDNRRGPNQVGLTWRRKCQHPNPKKLGLRCFSALLPWGPSIVPHQLEHGPLLLVLLHTVTHASLYSAQF